MDRYTTDEGMEMKFTTSELSEIRTAMIIRRADYRHVNTTVARTSRIIALIEAELKKRSQANKRLEVSLLNNRANFRKCYDQ